MNLCPAKTKIKIFKHKILKITFDGFWTLSVQS